MVEILKEQVAAANRILVADKNAYALGTASAIDRKSGVIVFSPIGLLGISLCPESMIVVSLNDGSIIEGHGRLHSDYLLHIAAYKAVPEMSALCHVHSEFVTVHAQAGNPVPVRSRFHAEHFSGQIACVPLSATEAGGNVPQFPAADEIAAALEGAGMEKEGAMLVQQDGALVWHRSPMKALDYANDLEKCLRLHYLAAKSSPSSVSSNVIPQNPKDGFPVKYDAPTFNDDGSVKPGKPGCMVTNQDRIHAGLFLLKYFDAFCRKNDIKYSLTGGTLLGAVRHGGFIPWDDDVDVFLTRPEYEKLVSTFKDDDRYVLMCRENDSHFNYVYGRLIDTKTLIKSSPNTAGAGYGLFLDVCVVDGLPNNNLLRWLHIKYMCFLMKGRACTIQTLKPKDMSTIGRAHLFIKKIIKHTTSTNFWNRLLWHSMRRWPFQKGKFVGNFTSQYGGNERLHRKVFDSYIDVPFEDGIFMACAGYQEYLRNIYGDYLSLPPVKKRNGHHPSTVIWVE